MLDILSLEYLTNSKPPYVNQSFVFLEHKHVVLSHHIFVAICIIYTPLIIIINTLVFWGILLYPGFHTTNNYLLLTLSIADFLMGAYCIPLYTLSYIQSTRPAILGNKHACLFLFASKQLAGSGSLLSLFLISVDRYIAVAWPYKYPFLISESRTVKFIIFQWILLIFLSFLPMLGLNHYSPKVNPLVLRCNYFTTLPRAYVLAWLSFITLAISVSAVLHIRIIMIAIRQVSRFKNEISNFSREQIIQFQNRVNSVKLTSFLMLVFVILYLPYVLVTPFKYLNLFSPVNTEIIQVVAQLLIFGNSLVNGPIYAIARTEYRRVYLTMLTAWPWRWRRELRNLHREHHSSMYSTDGYSPKIDRAYTTKTTTFESSAVCESSFESTSTTSLRSTNV